MYTLNNNEDEKKIIEKYKLIEGNYRIRIRILEACDLISKTSNNYLNSYVLIKTLDSNIKKTKAIEKSLSPVWNETFLFEFNDWKKEEIQKGKIEFSVWSEYLFGLKKEVIGIYELDISEVYFNINHSFFNIWLTLTDPEDKIEGPMGFLKCCIEVLGPKDEAFVNEIITDSLFIREKTLISEKIKPKGHLIMVEIYNLENILPVNLLTKYSNIFVVINYGGFFEKTKIISTSENNINQIIFLQTYLPNHSNLISLELWINESSFFSNKLIATCNIYFNSIKNTNNQKIKWYNFYGSPLTSEGKNSELFSLNGERWGSTFRGRILARFSSKNEENPENHIMDIEYKMPDILLEFPRERYYTLKIDLLEGFQLPSNKQGIIHFVLGPYHFKSQIKKVNNGKAEFYETLNNLKVLLPEDIEQIPDLIIYFCDKDIENRRITYKRYHPKYFFSKLNKSKENNKYLDNLGNKFEIIKFRENKPLNLLDENSFPGYILAKIRLFSYDINKLENDFKIEELKNENNYEEYEFRALVYTARNLVSGSKNGISNPFVEININGKSFNTNVNFESTLNEKQEDNLKENNLYKIKQISTINTLNPNFFQMIGGKIKLFKLKENKFEIFPLHLTILMFHSKINQYKTNISNKDKLLLGRQIAIIDKKEITINLNMNNNIKEIYNNSIYKKAKWYPLINDKLQKIEGEVMISFLLIKKEEFDRNLLKFDYLKKQENFLDEYFKEENKKDEEFEFSNEKIDLYNINKPINISKYRINFGIYLLGLRDINYYFDNFSKGKKFEVIVKINNNILEKYNFKLENKNQLISTIKNKLCKPLIIDIWIPKNKNLCPVLEILFNKINNTNRELIGFGNYSLKNALLWIYGNEDNKTYKKKWLNILNTNEELLSNKLKNKTNKANKIKYPQLKKENYIIFQEKLIFKKEENKDLSEKISSKIIKKLRKKKFYIQKNLKNYLLKELKNSLQILFNYSLIKFEDFLKKNNINININTNSKELNSNNNKIKKDNENFSIPTDNKSIISNDNFENLVINYSYDYSNDQKNYIINKLKKKFEKNFDLLIIKNIELDKEKFNNLLKENKKYYKDYIDNWSNFYEENLKIKIKNELILNKLDEIKINIFKLITFINKILYIELENNIKIFEKFTYIDDNREILLKHLIDKNIKKDIHYSNYLDNLTYLVNYLLLLIYKIKDNKNNIKKKKDKFVNIKDNINIINLSYYKQNKEENINDENLKLNSNQSNSNKIVESNILLRSYENIEIETAEISKKFFNYEDIRKLDNKKEFIKEKKNVNKITHFFEYVKNKLRDKIQNNIRYYDFETDENEDYDDTLSYLKGRLEFQTELEKTNFLNKNKKIITNIPILQGSNNNSDLTNNHNQISHFKCIFFRTDIPNIVNPNKIKKFINKITEVNYYTVRIYILKGIKITGIKNVDENIETYLKLRLNDIKINDKKEKRKGIYPEYYRNFEFNNIELPGNSVLHLDIFESNLFKDNLIGSTKIDLENRLFSNKWYSSTKKPIEKRSIKNILKGKRGKLEMWIDIIPNFKNKSPLINIFPKNLNEYELRVIIWNTKNVRIKDELTKSNDLFVRGCISNTNDWKETDTHWICRGKGSFNWRWKFKMNLPIDKNNNYGGDKFKIQLWDRDLINQNDLIGETEIDLNNHNLLKKVVSRNKSVYIRKRIEGSGEITNQIWYDVFHPEAVDEDENKISQGKILMTFEILPKYLSELHNNAEGRENPNFYPTLPQPTGRFRFNFKKPLESIKEIIGDSLYYKIMFVLIIYLFGTNIINLVFVILIQITRRVIV